MNKKPALIAALVGVALVLVMVVGLITPKAAQVKNKQQDIEKAHQQQLSLQAQLEQLQAAAQEAPADRKKLATLEAEIPPTADLPGLIRLLNATADQAQVDFATIAPGQPTPTGQLTVIPLQITVNGTFFAVDQYLRILERLPRVSKVTNLTLTPTDQSINPPQLQMAITVNFFTTEASAGPGAAPVQQAPPVGGPVPAPSPTEG